MRDSMVRWHVFVLLLWLAGPVLAETVPRWYTDAQLRQGGQVFQQHCASCHGKQAEGTPDWRKTGPDGKYPPPPLNGTAHAWHHSLKVLLQQIRRGGKPLGGTMPAFADKLGDEQMLAAIAWFQSRWPERVYRIWAERNLSRRGAQGGFRAPPPVGENPNRDGRRQQAQP